MKLLIQRICYTFTQTFLIEFVSLCLPHSRCRICWHQLVIFYNRFGFSGTGGSVVPPGPHLLTCVFSASPAGFVNSFTDFLYFSVFYFISSILYFLPSGLICSSFSRKEGNVFHTSVQQV